MACSARLLGDGQASREGTNMGELDFQQRQVLADADRTVAERIREAVLLGVVLLGLYVVVLWGLRIARPGMFLAFLVLAAGAIWAGSRARTIREWVWGLAARNPRTVNAYLALGALLFPVVTQDNQYLIYVGTLAGIFALMALGLNITLGFAGLLDLGYAAYFAAGAYTSARLATVFGVPFWVGLVLAGVVAAVFGFIIAWPCLRVQEKYLALVTLGFGLMVELLARNLKVLTNGTDGVIEIPPPAVGHFSFLSPLRIGGLTLPFQANYYYLVLAMIAVAVLVSQNLRRSRLGRSWEAIREDETAAICFGINLMRYKLLAFCTGSFMAGVAGAVFAHMISFIHPDTFNFSLSMGVLCMVVAGGMGNIRGAILGAVFFVVVPERLRDFEKLRLLLFGLSLLLLMLYRPEGIFPAVRRRIEIEARRLEELLGRWGGERAGQAPPVPAVEERDLRSLS